MKIITSARLYLLLTCFIIVNLQSFSQETPLCGTETSQEDLNRINNLMPQLEEFEEQFYNLQQSRSSTIPTSVPVKVHIIRTSTGTGGLTTQELDDAFTNMNAYYANSLMEFFICDGINYIDSNTYYNYQNSDEATMTSTYNVSGLINIYFANSVTDTGSGSGLCGYAYYPGGPDVILMANNCAINGSTLIHEMGHFFSLIHTHGPSNSTLTTELVDGSNCSTDGDLMCDTPADPKLSYGTVNTSCIYTGTDIDANGTAFTPDTHNMMSYSRKDCRDFISNEQYARIYAAFQVARNYFECPSISADFNANITSTCNNTLDVNFTDSSVGATSWQWDVDGDDIIDYTTQNPSHTYSATGSYDVNLKISDGTTTIAKTFVKYIKVGTEENLPIDQNFDAITLASDIDWSNYDVAGNGFAWTITSAQTPSPNTGPLTDVSGSGRYIYTEATGSNPSDVAELISNCIQINSDNAILEFAYHMFGASMGELHVDIDSGSGFVNDVTTAIVGQQQALQSDAFTTRQIDLSGYANQNIRIRFRGIRGPGFQSDMALDTVTITGTLSTVSFDLNSITLYPNPVNTNILHIETSNNLNQTNYRIHNLLGQDIMSGNLIQKQVDVSALSSGTYFLSLSVGNSKIVKKFIKQ